jgi:exodeoxyribonuclease V gamma subunit
MELLAKEKLCQVLQKPLANPLQAERVVVQTRGVGVWLKREIATEMGVAMNIEFPFLQRFIEDDVLSLCAPSETVTGGMQRAALSWRIFMMLPDLAKQFSSLGKYLSVDSETKAVKSLKCYQLAECIAQVFDQYQVYRPDLLVDWESGMESDDLWQSHLWRALQQQQLESTTHRLLEFCKGNLDTSTLRQYERVCVFGISSMPVIYLDFFTKLGEITDVHFFYLNPSRAYWEFALSDKEIALLSRTVSQKEWNADLEDLHFDENCNPLLASLGRLGREFFAAVMNSVNDYDDGAFQEPETESLLGRVQLNILDSQYDDAINNNTLSGPSPSSLTALRPDNSIQIHVCHSRLRELEVLRDRVLALLDGDKSLKPADIMVMAPDITEYATLIDAVFGEPIFNFTGADRFRFTGERIPYTVSDRSLEMESGPVACFLQLLELTESRFEVSAVLDYLSFDCIQEAFDIGENELSKLRHWIVDAGIRWGIDGHHRVEMMRAGEPFDQNSWRMGIERMLLGYAMSAEQSAYGIERLFGDALPYDLIEGEQGDLLGRFLHFFENLKQHAERMRLLIASPEEWAAFLRNMIHTFIQVDSADQKDCHLLFDVLNEFVESATTGGMAQKLDVSVVRYWLESRLSAETRGGHFLRGGITFCTMLPMRSIPAKVVCLLGMSDVDFPRQERRNGFDVIAHRVRLCDRSKRLEDKYAFLEALLSARDHFYLSYVGRDQKSNDVKPPATPLAELVDYLNDLGRLHGVENLANNLTTEHRLQPFNKAYFESDNELFSYSKPDFQAANSLQSQKAAPPIFFDQKQLNAFVPEVEGLSGNLELQLIKRFFRNPVSFFFKNVARIELEPRLETELVNEESFEPDKLNEYQLRCDVIEALVLSAPIRALYEKYRAAGVLPCGLAGYEWFHRIVQEMRDVLHVQFPALSGIMLRELLALSNPMDASLSLGNRMVEGRIKHVQAHEQHCQSVICAPSKSLAKPMMLAWIDHLFLNAAGKNTDTWCMVGKSESELKAKHFTPMPQHTAQSYFEDLLDIFQQGIQNPIPFMPQTSYELAKGKSCEKKWNGGEYTPNSDSKNVYVAACFDRDAPWSAQWKNSFESLAKRVFVFAADKEFEFLEEMPVTTAKTRKGGSGEY